MAANDETRSCCATCAEASLKGPLRALVQRPKDARHSANQAPSQFSVPWSVVRDRIPFRVAAEKPDSRNAYLQKQAKDLNGKGCCMKPLLLTIGIIRKPTSKHRSKGPYKRENRLVAANRDGGPGQGSNEKA